MRRAASVLRLFGAFFRVKVCGVWLHGLGTGAAAAGAAKRQTGPRRLPQLPAWQERSFWQGGRSSEGKEYTKCVYSLWVIVVKQHRGENTAVLHPSVSESKIRRN